MVLEQLSRWHHSAGLDLPLALYTWLEAVVFEGRRRQQPLPQGSGSSTYCLTWSVGRRLLVQASTFPLAVTRLEHAAR
jgi:hypothetical protein